MEWIERLNDAIGYIEEHLTDEIDYGQLGRIAFRECLLTWQVFLCLNISVEEECHLLL